MNEKSIEASEDNIVLLAEGELSPKDKEALLARVDATDDWKRVAIALLQTQALHAGMENMNQSNAIGPVTPSETNQLSTKELPISHASIRWTMAICLALVFLLGGVVGHFAGKPIPIANIESIDSDRESGQSRLVNTKDPNVLAKVYQAVDSIGVNDSELIAFVNVESNSERKVFPLIRSQELARQIQLTSNPNLSKKVESHMRKSGWEVRSTKQFVSINLPNGKSKIVPIGLLNYKFIGNPVF